MYMSTYMSIYTRTLPILYNALVANSVNINADTFRYDGSFYCSTWSSMVFYGVLSAIITHYSACNHRYHIGTPVGTPVCVCLSKVSAPCVTVYIYTCGIHELERNVRTLNRGIHVIYMLYMSCQIIHC